MSKNGKNLKQGRASNGPTLWGQSRIAAALEKTATTLSDGYLVPYYNHYYENYHSHKLPTLTRVKDIHKTHCVDARKRHYVNYALRACVLSMKKEIDENPNAKKRLAMITVNFSHKYSQKLRSLEFPTSHYGTAVMRRLASVGVDKFFIVFEAGKANKAIPELISLHAHIVLTIDPFESEEVRACLRNEFELKRDIRGSIASSSVMIQFQYTPRLYTCSPLQSALATLEQQLLGEQSQWVVDERAVFSGRIRSLKSRDPIELNIGIADYLSKELPNSIFSKGRNYYISRPLNAEIKVTASERINV
ncbi:hypothetical protein P2G88_12635 [Aliiglaciecola sp. CAU 1673]|uniref:hypothetical protein n=1 Tax=Aliiglaciecola sp. CAU 1673 TaxID=3032595 RepID=UPI0023DCBD22|nr:hypothetical protein [Aliiglaciecola sp. CAU 1673]MDF2179099.1 hypothetical protein [Aliiglaciecola sp. CAU 1673]